MLALLYYVLHATACLTRRSLGEGRPGTKLGSLLSFYFLVYTSNVCLLYCFHGKVCMVAKQNSILSLYFMLTLSIAKICYRDPHISLLIGNSLYMDHAAVFHAVV